MYASDANPFRQQQQRTRLNYNSSFNSKTLFFFGIFVLILTLSSFYIFLRNMCLIQFFFFFCTQGSTNQSWLSTEYRPAESIEKTKPYKKKRTSSDTSGDWRTKSFHFVVVRVKWTPASFLQQSCKTPESLRFQQGHSNERCTWSMHSFA